MPTETQREREGERERESIWFLDSRDCEPQWQGYYATLASFGPFSALYFAFYEQAACLWGGKFTKQTGAFNQGSGVFRLQSI